MQLDMNSIMDDSYGGGGKKNIFYLKIVWIKNWILLGGYGGSSGGGGYGGSSGGGGYGGSGKYIDHYLKLVNFFW